MGQRGRWSGSTLLFILLSSPAIAAPELMEFRGICDASAAVALDDKRIIVGDDELPWLSIYRLDTQQQEAKIPLPFSGAGESGGSPEADIEAATVLEDQIVWISSHGRNKNGKVHPDRYQFFASHRLGADGTTWQQAFSPSYHGLLDDIVAVPRDDYAPLRAAIGDLSKKDPNLAPKKHGFNIEGMAADPEGKVLLVGLRNPQKDGKALLFRIEKARDLLMGTAAKPSLGAVLPLKLGGRGIRDIAWSPAHQSYLVIAGQVDDDSPGPGFSVFRWTGKEGAEPQEIQSFGNLNQVAPDFHPEAIVPLKELTAVGVQFSKRILLISDDGTRPIAPGGECKKAAESGKMFRATVQTIP
jgi:hypothetical protein